MPPPTLAQRAFPKRVRMLLEGVLEYASDEIERGLAATLNEQEQQLFKLAEQARSNDVQARCFEALREIKRGRPDITPRFLISLEASLASLRDPPTRVSTFTTPGVEKGSPLALVEEVDMDEAVVLNEIAARSEFRNSLVLFLLGQRFGVVAGRPAFDAETLPVGPHALCRALREASGCLELNSEHRQSLFRQFDRQVMQATGPFYEALNTFLIRHRVLPNLTFVPIRPRPMAQNEDAPAATGGTPFPPTRAAPGSGTPFPPTRAAPGSGTPFPPTRAMPGSVTPFPLSRGSVPAGGGRRAGDPGVQARGRDGGPGAPAAAPLQHATPAAPGTPAPGGAPEEYHFDESAFQAQPGTEGGTESRGALPPASGAAARGAGGRGAGGTPSPTARARGNAAPAGTARAADRSEVAAPPGAGTGASAAGSGARDGDASAAAAGAADDRAASPGDRFSVANEAAARAAAAAAAKARDTIRPFTQWPGLPTAADSEPANREMEAFESLRNLLSGRRALLGKLDGNRSGGARRVDAVIAKEEQVQSVLGALQTSRPPPVVVDGKPVPRSIQHVKQDLLAQLRKVGSPEAPPTLAEPDADAIDLVGMLFDHIMKDVKPNTAAANLLGQLQVPLLRVALRDKAFFTKRQHPARQMLNAIAETGAYWNGDDEADRNLLQKMQMLVERVTSEFDGDLSLFDTLLDDLSGHMQTVVRKAEVAERRHVEAARGKEKLELSRLKAAESVDALLRGKRVPKFLNTLLGQAWTDVLALTLLRQGDDSDSFRHQLGIAERLVQAAVSRRTTGQTLIGPDEVQTLRGEIERSLEQVGYHGEDAQAVATRLVAASIEEEDVDPASRTELALRLKSRGRLGQNVEPRAPDGEKIAPLKPAEATRLQQIRSLPFGTWFEFTVNQQGDRVRRRLSWYSTVTGHCLFVNHRGQRVGEYSMSWLARELHRGNVSVVELEHGNLIDRAWQAVVGALRSFAGKPAPAEARSEA